MWLKTLLILYWLNTLCLEYIFAFRFIYEQSKKLHPNNYILINAKMKLGLLYGNYKPYLLNTMSRPSIDRKIQVYQKTILYILQRKRFAI